MSRVIYVNGAYLPYAQGMVHAEDRGFQFADAVYEVFEVRGGCLIDETRHIERLSRSLRELGMGMPMSRAALALVLRQTIRRNLVHSGYVYLQVTRGAGPRAFIHHDKDIPQSVVCLARSSTKAGIPADAPARAIAVKTVSDIRWGRCDIKTVMLLPAVLAKQAAITGGAEEAWFVDAGGFVTEGASSNAWIIDERGRAITRQADHEILRGVTRTTLIDFLKAEGIELVERAFGLAEAKAAKEAFITSATNPVTPVVRIDETVIGNGRPGPITLRLRSAFHSYAESAKL